MRPTEMTTGKVRLSYAYLFHPHSTNGGDEKYSVSVIIPKDDTATIGALNAAVQAAIQDGISSKWGGKQPKNLHLPLRDGDEERDDETYANSMFFNCSSKNAPIVIDKAKNEILDEDEVYSGCFAKVAINCYPYDSNGNRGIAVGLRAVQKIADGQRLGGSSLNINEAFADDDDDDCLD